MPKLNKQREKAITKNDLQGTLRKVTKKAFLHFPEKKEEWTWSKLRESRVKQRNQRDWIILVINQRTACSEGFS